MVKKNSQEPASEDTALSTGCCSVEAILNVDERGQMVLPKEIREKMGIKAGGKLALISIQKDGGSCCITLMKVEELTDLVTSILGPTMKEIV